MMQHRATLDYVGLPVGAPGSLECRLQLASYRPDGSYIDDGSRRPTMIRNVHRFVAEPTHSVDAVLATVAPHLVQMGYDPPDSSMIHHLAEHEWRREVLDARRARLKVRRPTHRIVLRALGFDLLGAGQLAVGLGQAIIRPDGARLTTKASVLLHPGDDIDTLLAGLDQIAVASDHEPLADEDRSLLRHVADRLWTADALARRERDWLEADDRTRALGASPLEARQLEYLSRLDGLTTWAPIPAATPERITP